MKAPGISMPLMPLKQGVAPEWDLNYLCSLLVQCMEPPTSVWRTKIQSLCEKASSRKLVPLYQLVLNISWITHPGTGACMCFWKFCMRFIPERSYRIGNNILLQIYRFQNTHTWCGRSEFGPSSAQENSSLCLLEDDLESRSTLGKRMQKKIFPACPGKGGRGDRKIHGERKWLSSSSQTTQWGWWFEFTYLDNFWDF